MAAVPGIVGGRFRLRELVGSGAAADVYRADDLQEGGEVAVKLAGDRGRRAETRIRFEREAAALSVLVSPHVVALIAAGATEPPDERPYLVLELLRGRTVQQELDACGPLPAADVAAWLGQAAAALDLAHSVGIVHRDLKPSNLYLHETGGARLLKVLDFGLVRDLADGGGAAAAADTGALLGTPLYMAPEQVRRQAALLGPETDVWALAMIAVALLTGTTYWSGGTATEVLDEIAGSPLVPPSTRWPWLSPAFDRWFERSTDRVPERRYRSVVEQADALAEALRGVTIPAGRRGRAPGDSGGTPQGGDATLAARTPTPALIRGAGAGPRPLVGRQVELARLRDALEPGALVALTGPAGVGKSRLAEAVAASVPERFPDGSWVCSLAGSHDQAAAAEAMARALELSADGGRPVMDAIAAALGPRRALIVLDGVEQAPATTALVAALRPLVPQIGWLLVGRVPLGLAGERRLVLEPLELPPASGLTAEEATAYAAVQLFLHCAPPAFAITESNVDDVVGICRLVDGLPLALELAAAQVRDQDIGGVLAHLRAAAAGGGTARDPVREAVAWSYGLLAGREQAILRAMAVLPAGVTFRGAQRLFGGDHGDRAALAAAILRLVDSNLLRWSTSEPPRLLMLDSVRELCRASSAELGEDTEVWRVALAYLQRIVERADEGLRGAEQADWLARLDAEHDNLLAALGWSLEYDAPVAMHMAAHLAWYWYLRGHYQEGSRWLEAALERVPAGAHRLRALHGAGRLAFLQCRYDDASALLHACRELAARLGRVREQAEAEQLMGSLARERGDYAAAARRHWRSLSLWQQLGDRREAARTRNYLAFLAWLSSPDGDPGGEDAPWRLGEAEAELATLGDHEGMVWSLLNRGAIAHYAGDRAGARAALGRAFAVAAGARFQEGIAWSLDLIGLGSLARGDTVQARAQLHASLRVHRRLGDLWRCASVLEELAALTVTAGRPARAAIYLGAADAIRERLGAPVPACERRLHDRTVQRGGELLGDAFARGRERGRRTSLDAVLILAAEAR